MRTMDRQQATRAQYERAAQLEQQAGHDEYARRWAWIHQRIADEAVRATPPNDDICESP